MANIDKELQAIQDAIYGEEVRSSIHDAIKAVNESATDSALVCETKASEAIESARIALEKALEILSTADTSKSYAVGGTGTREGEDTDNAKYYMKQAQSAASGLIPSGNVTFEQLMALTDVVVGAMYHVTNEFTTNDKFEDYATLGAEEYPAGTNVYMKVDGLWCTMVGSEVIGVKGNEEESYRTGHVNITKEDIGIVDATTEKAGIVKLSDSSAVTDSTGLALPATEKNATIEGTLANQLDILNSNLSDIGNISILMQSGYATGNNVDILDLSQYRMLAFIAVWDGAQFLNMYTIPYSLFMSFIGGVMVLKVSNEHAIEIRPVDNTHINLKCSSPYLKLRIYGIK